MPQLAIAKEFLSEYSRLEKPVQKAVQAALGKFAQAAHAGLHLEKLNRAEDPRIRTIRINQFYRGVVLAPATGDLYCLLRVLPHDDAIAWATTRLFTVNQVLGVLEIRDEAQLQNMSGTLRLAAETTPARLFDHVKDSDFRTLGIDDQVLPIVRLLAREAHLDALQHMLPSLQYDVLVALASGMSIDETWGEVSKHLVNAAKPDRVEPDDLSAAIERTPDQVALVSGPEELEKLLRPPFALWRIFLHPMQRRIAYHDPYPGSVMITGGAGTGKTVTALHRAAHLAELYDSGTPILVTTYSPPLTAELARQLNQLVENPENRDRIDVITTGQLASWVIRERRGSAPVVLTSRELVSLADSVHPDFAGKFLVDEWEQVMLAQDITTLEAYLAAARTGRSQRLPRSERSSVWAAVKALQTRLSDQGCWSLLQVADEAARILQQEDGSAPYQHVLVDEAQDLHPAQWRLLRAAVRPSDDDLFLVADPHQRIWQHRVPLKNTGINIVGRTQRLAVSYRTTHEILTWAVRVLGLVSEEDLDGWPDSREGYESPMHGRRPIVRRFTEWSEERTAVVSQVRAWLADGVEPGAIAVVARVNAKSEELAEALRFAGIEPEPPGPSGGRVQVGTMHSMKGLEFQCVAVVGVQDKVVPHERAIVPLDVDRAAHLESLQRERCVLYVACTRARDRLYVSYSGAPSPFLPR
ncbi:3'-5' exonuclease [Streptomyces sp. NPDC006459]|uniref:3'-5' exonuclease n=1 Tax=Streptomyces sp. NPDC006459 TaxID=3154303 RepID=UPI0033A0315D